jgi:ABC-type amino acid transport substrate-binding protein
MNKKLILVLIFALLASLLAACGGGSQEVAQSNTGGQTEGTAEKQEQPADNTTLGKIKASSVLTVGIEGAYPPFNFFNDKNELEGFDVEITKEIANRMGVKVEFVATPWDSIIGGLLAKKYDLIISSMAITEERQKKVDFTEPYYHTGAQIFAPKDSDIKAHEEIKGKKVGVTIGTTFAKKAEELGAESVTYKNDQLAFQDLANGRIAAVITDKAVGARITVEEGYPFHAVGDLLFSEDAGITIRKEDDALREEINKHLNDILNDGSYKNISMKWFGEDIR